MFKCLHLNKINALCQKTFKIEEKKWLILYVEIIIINSFDFASNKLNTLRLESRFLPTRTE